MPNYLLLLVCRRLSCVNFAKPKVVSVAGQRSYDSTKDSSRRDNFITSNVIILQGIISLVYVCSEIQLIEPPRDVDCTTYYYVNLFSFAFALYCAYFLLWFRIYRTFYKNKLIQQSLNKCFYCVHILILLLITLLSVVLPLLSLLVLSGLSYVSVGCGCVARNINGGFQLPRLFVISGFLSFLSHLIFIFFFVYPLCLHKSHIVKMGLNQRKYRYVIKRVAVAGGICAATDLVSFILAMIFPSPTVYFPHFLYSCNLVVNLIGILMTFTNWRDRLFPYNIVK